MEKFSDGSRGRLADLPQAVALPDFEAGSVWIVGAGPGDVGLLTLHALNGLRQADVVLHDSLVSPAVLALADRAELKYVGKKAGERGRKQRDISELMIASARSGQRVLRLKGGDPGIFGRGGEEAEALVQAGIPFRVFAGVTAALAAGVAASLPLTHRAVNHAVVFVTGHSASSQHIDWTGIARSVPVIVLYMAGEALGDIAALLIEAGRGADEPVVLVSHASLPGERVVHTCLGEAGKIDLPAPMTAIIGQTRSWGED